MSNSISQRDSFWNKIYDIAKQDRRIVIVSADMGAPALDRIRREMALLEESAAVVADKIVLYRSLEENLSPSSTATKETGHGNCIDQ